MTETSTEPDDLDRARELIHDLKGQLGRSEAELERQRAKYRQLDADFQTMRFAERAKLDGEIGNLRHALHLCEGQLQVARGQVTEYEPGHFTRLAAALDQMGD